LLPVMVRLCLSSADTLWFPRLGWLPARQLMLSLLLTSIGIWDCLSSQQVVDFTRRAIANGDSLTRIAENMMEKCLAPDSELGGVGCDNMTVVVIAVLNGKTVEEWQAWVKNRVENNVSFRTFPSRRLSCKPGEPVERTLTLDLPFLLPSS
jgi:hypothetical protein